MRLLRSGSLSRAGGTCYLYSRFISTMRSLYRSEVSSCRLKKLAMLRIYNLGGDTAWQIYRTIQSKTGISWIRSSFLNVLLKLPNKSLLVNGCLIVYFFTIDLKENARARKKKEVKLISFKNNLPALTHNSLKYPLQLIIAQPENRVLLGWRILEVNKIIQCSV